MSDNVNQQVVVSLRLQLDKGVSAPERAKLQFAIALRRLDAYLKEFDPSLVSAFVSKPFADKAWTGLAVIEVRAGSVREVLQKDKPPYVEYWEPNSVLTLCAFDDPEYTRRNGQWGLKRIGALEAWTTKVSTPVTIGVVDSGLMWRWDATLNVEAGAHEDLDGRAMGAAFPPRLWRSGENPPMDGMDGDGNDYVDDLNGARVLGQPPPGMMGDGEIGDEHGHGTLLAGIMFATPGNNTGIASLLTQYWPGIKLMPVKFFDADRRPTPANARQAIEYAADNGAKVITASWHTGPSGNGLLPLEQAIAYARSLGVLVVTAAGNDGRNNDVYPTAPANLSLTYDNVLTVHATDRGDRRPSFSNYGKTSVHLGAPGKKIETTRRYIGSRPGYLSINGTSAAAAFASVAAALVFAIETQRGNNRTPAQVITHLRNTADVIPQLSSCSISGGRLNLAKAVTTPI